MNLNSLSLQEKIGQKFMFGINSNNIDIIINLIKKYHIGGVILYKKNYSNYKEMLSVIKKLKKANSKNKIPLFIAIDQEGGRVNRMPSEFKNLKNIYEMSKKDKSLIYDSSMITGKMLKQIGINMNFAPVMDVYEEKGNVLYNRCFYGDIEEVYNLGKIYVEGLKNNDVISVVKHFPGHGISSIDSHFITPYVYNYKNVLEKHILPFNKILNDKVDAMMVNHLVIRNLTGGLPSSISKKLLCEYLRKENKYDGLIITDEINMLSKNIFYKFNFISNLVNSGSDIVLVKVKDNNTKIIDKYIEYVRDNNCIDLIDSSVGRILKIKEKYNVNDDVDYDGCNISLINNEIDRINKMCL